MASIVRLDQFMLNRHEKKLSEYQNVTMKKGSSKLYCDFRYNGKRILKSSGMNDSPDNRERLQAWVDEQKKKIEDGIFVFSEAFPGATDEEKAYHASCEGRDFVKAPANVSFGDYVEMYINDFLNNFESETKKVDYESIINSRLMPFFKEKSFDKLTGVELEKFIGTLKHEEGSKKGQPLSPSRINNIMIPLRTIYYHAIEEHGWQLRDPFNFLKTHKVIKPRKKSVPEVFRFDEFMKILLNMPPHYALITEFIVMTGMIHSEISGFKDDHMTDSDINVSNSIVPNKRSVASGKRPDPEKWYREKDTLKNDYRIRNIRITGAMRTIIEKMKAQGLSDGYIFSMQTGGRFNGDSFRKHVWTKALKKAGLDYRKPYTLRHTFVAWSLTIGMDMGKLEDLMGHGSKEMIFNIYGKYVKGLEKDAGKILDYFGNDFL